jgi:hypothetical protein
MKSALLAVLTSSINVRVNFGRRQRSRWTFMMATTVPSAPFIYK